MRQRTYDNVAHTLLGATTAGHRTLRRVSGGRLGRRAPGGRQFVWLTVPGRRSGQPRTVPLLAVRDRWTGTRDPAGDDPAWVVIGSNAGQLQAPAWVHNLRAHPDAELEVNGERYPIRAEEVTDEAEYARLFGLLVGAWRGYTGYARRAGRPLPVFRLQRVRPPA